MEQYKCQLCYTGQIFVNNDDPNYISKLPEIINNCSKYLTIETSQFNFGTFGYNQNPFCQQCGESVWNLSELHIQLEQITNKIDHLVRNLKDKILVERQKYDLLRSSVHSTIQTHQHSQIGSININQLQQGVPSTNASYETGNNDSCDFQPAFSNDDDYFNDASASTPTHPADEEQFQGSVSTSSKVEKKTKRKHVPKKRNTDKKGKVSSNDLILQKGSAGFECPTCHKRFTHLNVLQLHECGSQTYDCEMCGKSFFSEGSLKLHRVTHSGIKPHKCETCGKHFSLPHHLRLHIRRHTGERPYACDICEKRFIDAGELAKHKRKHTTDENERNKYKCEFCKKAYSTYDSLKFHVRLHTGDKASTCEECGRVFSREIQLKKHYVVHTKEKIFKCTFCWKSYGRLSTLQAHLKIHGKERPYQCDKCGKAYATRMHLNAHERTAHVEQKEHICDICGSVTKSKLALEHHIRYHNKVKSSVRHDCIVCGKTYSSHRDLNLHQRRDHSVIADKLTKCEKCGTEFPNEVTYNKHLKIVLKSKHKGRPLFQCDICRLQHNSHCQLIYHFNDKHPKAELPNKCSHCGERFLRKSELLNHALSCEARLRKPSVAEKKEENKKKIPIRKPTTTTGNVLKNKKPVVNLESKTSKKNIPLRKSVPTVLKKISKTQVKTKTLRKMASKEQDNSTSLRRSSRVRACNSKGKNYSLKDDSTSDEDNNVAVRGEINENSSSSDDSLMFTKMKIEDDYDVKQEAEVDFESTEFLL